MMMASDLKCKMQQGLPRSQSLPALKSEEAILKKIQEQDGIISLMQTQIEFQSELIAKHDKIFEDLLNKVKELSSKVKSLEESSRTKSETKEREAARSALWGGGSVSVSTVVENTASSLAEMVKETAEQTLGTAESGFVFDEKLGLYFDQSSGYYYDPVKSLYYNGHTKTFYSYDATTNSYQVHSTVTTTSTSDSIKRKKKSSRKVTNKKQASHKKVETSEKGVVTVLDSQSTEPTNQNKKNSNNNGGGDSEEGGDTVEDASNNNNSNLSALLSPSSSSVKSAKCLSDMEEGEISSSVTTSAESSPRGGSDSKESESCEEEESAEGEDESNLLLQRQSSYPPCIRAVVQEFPSASNKDIKKGSLFVVPYTGGTIGSKGSSHAILLESTSVEKNHAKIHYEQMEHSEATSSSDSSQQQTGSGKYFITDLGSEEGTYLNRTRLSDSGGVSEPQEVVHGSTLQVGDVVLLIHIHPGDFTCGHCEPGLILQKEPLYEYTANKGETARRSEMKKIKKKYGLDRKNEGASLNNPEHKYVDRAKSRRVKVGSDNPFAKTEVASTATPIRESNKGFKMLQKMGWKGEGLGKTENQGIKEPISCEVKTDRLGLGLGTSDPLLAIVSSGGKSNKKFSSKEQKRLESLAKTLERFNEAQSPKQMEDQSPL